MDRDLIWVFTVVHNEEEILPWFLRHYGAFADRIIAWDDGSTDRSRQILKAHPLVTLLDWPHATGLHEDVMLHHAYEMYPAARKSEWVAWVDCDEFIFRNPDIRFFLESVVDQNLEVINTAGFNMVGDGLPRNGYEYRQIWEHLPNGVSAPAYSKPVVFRPDADIRWVRGKHALEGVTPIGFNLRPQLKLLHYRYLGAEYTRRKNAKNYNRCGGATGDKGAAWSCAPTYDGPDKEHSPAWAEAIKSSAFNVIESPL